jgi:hypothetical protein
MRAAIAALLWSMLTWVLAEPALAGDCGERLTVAPMLTPLWTPLPYGGNVRFDHTFSCPETRGASQALTVDVGAVPIWIGHTGWFPTLRQQVGLHLEPAARGRVPGGPYMAVRLGITELFFDGTYVVAVPGAVLGYRYEARSGFTAQFGAGLEFWLGEFEGTGWPAIELRAGKAFGRAAAAPASGARL